jgi:hypothetical protein
MERQYVQIVCGCIHDQYGVVQRCAGHRELAIIQPLQRAKRAPEKKPNLFERIIRWLQKLRY